MEKIASAIALFPFSAVANPAANQHVAFYVDLGL
jgi:hypothetical protein